MKALVAAKSPKNVFYSSKPLPQGGEIETLSPDALGKKLGFEFTESLFGDPSVLNHILNDSTLHNAIQNRPGLPKEAAILERLKSPLEDTFVVCDMGPEVGHGLFAKKEIPAGTVLFLYAGEVGVVQHYFANDNYAYAWASLSQDSATYTHAVSPRKQGGLARFMQHLPGDPQRHRKFLEERSRAQLGNALIGKEAVLQQALNETMKSCSDHELEDVFFKDSRDRERLAIGNVRLMQMVVGNVPVVVCSTIYSIKAGEQLGYTYGELYWRNKEVYSAKKPRYFYRDTGALIPTSAYFYPKQRDAVAAQALVARATPANPLNEYNKGIASFKSKEFAEAIKHLNNALALYSAQANKDNVACANCCSTLASCYRELGNVQQAKDYCNQALSFCDKEKNSELVGQIEKKLAGLSAK